MKPDLYPRRCDECRTGMWEGYVFAGDETYCEACAFESPEDKAEWLANWNPEGDDYWTEWTEIEWEAYTKEGHPVPIDGFGRPLPRGANDEH